MSKNLPLDWHKRRSGRNMSAKAELVLNMLYIQHENANETPVTIMETIKLAQHLGIGSMVSCHIAMEWLNKNGFIKVVQSLVDKRNKVISLTAKGKGYFA